MVVLRLGGRMVARKGPRRVPTPFGHSRRTCEWLKREKEHQGRGCRQQYATSSLHILVPLVVFILLEVILLLLLVVVIIIILCSHH